MGPLQFTMVYAPRIFRNNPSNQPRCARHGANCSLAAEQKDVFPTGIRSSVIGSFQACSGNISESCRFRSFLCCAYAIHTARRSKPVADDHHDPTDNTNERMSAITVSVHPPPTVTPTIQPIATKTAQNTMMTSALRRLFERISSCMGS